MSHPRFAIPARRMPPRGNPTAWAEAIFKQQTPAEAEVFRLVNNVRAAFEALKSGTTESRHFDRVGAAFNIAMIRASAIDPLCEQTMRLGMDALERCAELFYRHGRYGFFGGPDRELVNDAIELYAQILALSTPGQMEDATMEVARRMIAQGQETAS